MSHYEHSNSHATVYCLDRSHAHLVRSAHISRQLARPGVTSALLAPILPPWLPHLRCISFSCSLLLFLSLALSLALASYRALSVSLSLALFHSLSFSLFCSLSFSHFLSFSLSLSLSRSLLRALCLALFRSLSHVIGLTWRHDCPFGRQYFLLGCSISDASLSLSLSSLSLSRLRYRSRLLSSVLSRSLSHEFGLTWCHECPFWRQYFLLGYHI